MPKVVDYRQTDAQATNKTVTQDRHEVLSRFGRQEGVIPVRKMDPWPIYFGFWCLMTNTTKLD